MKPRSKEVSVELKGARFSFKTIVLISALIGFCGYLLFIPFIIVFAGDIKSILVLIFVAPAMGVLNGAIAGIAGYPLYSLVVNRYFTMSVKGYVRDED